MRIDQEAHPETHPARRAVPRPARALGCVSLVLLLLGILTRGFTFPMIIADVGIDSTWLATPLMGAFTILTLVIVVRAARRWSWAARWTLYVLAGAAALVIWTGLALFWFLNTFAPPSFHVLAPPGPTGCRIVVREASFTFAGSGSVYALPAGHVIGRQVSTYETDDGLQPVGRGWYDLTWEGEQARFFVGRTDNDPVWPNEHLVRCA